MNAIQEQTEQAAVSTLPELAVPTAERAISLVNRWLQREVGLAVSTSRAFFNPVSYCWHMPVHLAYGSTGPLGVIGDVFLHAATGDFVGRPGAEELQQRAVALAKAHGFTEED
ncbi:MAG: hypothetical protein MOB07_01175 [Acidobacteria bacterium]|nr:hypothetical protein [Acidobacteriota bacterium]